MAWQRRKGQAASSKATKSHPRPEQSLLHRISRRLMSDTGTLSFHACKRARTSSLWWSSWTLVSLAVTLDLVAFFLHLFRIIFLGSGALFGLATIATENSSGPTVNETRRNSPGPTVNEKVSVPVSVDGKELRRVAVACR